MEDGLGQDELNELLDRYDPESPVARDVTVRPFVDDTGHACIKVTGCLLGPESIELVQAAARTLHETPGALIVDVAHCTFFSSMGLAALATVADDRMQYGGRTYIVGAQDRVRKAIWLLGLGRLLQLTETIEAARAAADQDRLDAAGQAG